MDGTYSFSDDVVTGGDYGIDLVALAIDTITVLQSVVIQETSIAPTFTQLMPGLTATAIIED